MPVGGRMKLALWNPVGAMACDSLCVLWTNIWVHEIYNLRAVRLCSQTDLRLSFPTNPRLQNSPVLLDCKDGRTQFRPLCACAPFLFSAPLPPSNILPAFNQGGTDEINSNINSLVHIYYMHIFHQWSMAGNFGRITVGIYVEIKRSDGKFNSNKSFSDLALLAL